MGDAGNRKRQEAGRLLQELKERGYEKVRIEGKPKNDLVDVCRLTCLEEAVKVVSPAREEGQEDTVPVLTVDSRELFLEWPKERNLLS